MLIELSRKNNFHLHYNVRSDDVATGSILLERVLTSNSDIPYCWPDSFFQYFVQICISIYWSVEPHHWKTMFFHHALSCIQPLHAGLLAPNIDQFVNVELILIQTTFRRLKLSSQTKIRQSSTKTCMQSSWQVYWPEKELVICVACKLSILICFAKTFLHWDSIRWALL